MTTYTTKQIANGWFIALWSYTDNAWKREEIVQTAKHYLYSDKCYKLCVSIDMVQKTFLSKGAMKCGLK